MIGWEDITSPQSSSDDATLAVTIQNHLYSAALWCDAKNKASLFLSLSNSTSKLTAVAKYHGFYPARLKLQSHLRKLTCAWRCCQRIFLWVWVFFFVAKSSSVVSLEGFVFWFPSSSLLFALFCFLFIYVRYIPNKRWRKLWNWLM